MKKVFDILFSFLGIIILSPVFLIIALIVKIDSQGKVFYKQTRVGKDGIDFKLFKFRTMGSDSDKSGLLTVGERDTRITKSGYYLRKYKLDELPQLINILKGDMSFVGPRPEVRKYVEMYSEEQKEVLSALPGITDVASIKYRNENEMLEKSGNPEEYYINNIMPDKINLNLEYLKQRSFVKDIGVILKTLKEIFK